MTTIKHTDRHGRQWVFNLDVNTVQERMFKKLLSSVLNIGACEELRFDYYTEGGADANGKFWDEVENVVLSALDKWADVVTPTVEAELLRKPERHDTDTGGVEEERTPYYWENF